MPLATPRTTVSTRNNIGFQDIPRFWIPQRKSLKAEGEGDQPLRKRVQKIDEDKDKKKVMRKVKDDKKKIVKVKTLKKSIKTKERK